MGNTIMGGVLPTQDQASLNKGLASARIGGAERAGPGGEKFSRSEPPLKLVSKSAAAGRGSLAQNLRETFEVALKRYHRLDGLQDGSPLTGVQYPPVSQVKNGDEAGLRQFIGDLSDYLSKQPGIGYAAPADPQDRTAFREKIAEKAAPQIDRYAVSEFKKMIRTIHDPGLRAFVNKAVAEAPPQFFLAPSSSSGNFHPADEINKRGLLVHTIRDVKMGKVLAKYFNLSQKETDEITAALLLHDIEKGGVPWKGKAPDYGYDAAHGPIAEVWLKKIEGESTPDEKVVEDEVGTHMAQWNKPLPTPPKTLGEQIVSYADYLASQDTVYMSWRSSHPS